METTKKLLEEIAGLAARRADDELLMLFKRRLRKLHEEDKDLQTRLSHIISSAGGVGAARRFQVIDEFPKDTDSGMDLIIRIDHNEKDIPPILPPQTQLVIERFIKERLHAVELKKAGIAPPSSLALMGKPGTGKTSLARWIAHRLEIPFFTLNIASVVTSYLGKTGQNLKRALDRAKLEPSVLLLDEFDAIGYQRSDESDVGEMKRVVTVLLQEVENWPEQSVVIAATNIPEHVDIAFKRRFSRWVELPLPGLKERLEILSQYYGPGGPKNFIRLAALCLTGVSGADLLSFSKRVRSLEILEKMAPREAIMNELSCELMEKGINPEESEQFVIEARKIDPRFFSYRKLGALLGISHTQVAKILSKSKNGAP